MNTLGATSQADRALVEIAREFTERWPGLAQQPALASLVVHAGLSAWNLTAAQGLDWLRPGVAGLDLEIDRVARGRKRAALKESIPSGDAAALVAAYRAMGLFASEVARHGMSEVGDAHGSGDAFALIAVAATADDLSAVLDAQRAIAARRLGGEAIERMGDLMGYPRCCVAAFVAQSDRRDNIANERAPFRRAPGEALDWRVHRLATVRLISHHLCAPACAESVAIAQDALDRVATLDPHGAEWVTTQLDAPMLFLDYIRRVRIDGAWGDGGFAVSRAAVIPGPIPADIEVEGLLEIAVAPTGAALRYADGAVRELASPAPLLTTPGAPLDARALAAIGGPMGANVAPTPTRPPGVLPLPSAFRVGATVRDHAIVSLATHDDGYRIVLGRGTSTISLFVRRHDPSASFTIRHGRWAIDIEHPELLAEDGRGAVRVLVAALPR